LASVRSASAQIPVGHTFVARFRQLQRREELGGFEAGLAAARVDSDAARIEIGRGAAGGRHRIGCREHRAFDRPRHELGVLWQP
jgi:hypothetical protein